MLWEIVMTLPCNWSPGVILDDLWSILQAGAVGNGPGPDFGQKTDRKQKLKPRFQFPKLSLTRVRKLGGLASHLGITTVAHRRCGGCLERLCFIYSTERGPPTPAPKCRTGLERRFANLWWPFSKLG